jgi:hypothetical protein
MYGCSRSRVCDCTRRYDFSVGHGLVFPLKFLGVRVAAVYYIRRGQKKMLTLPINMRENTFVTILPFYPEVGTLMSSEHKVISASFFSRIIRTIVYL